MGCGASSHMKKQVTLTHPSQQQMHGVKAMVDKVDQANAAAAAPPAPSPRQTAIAIPPQAFTLLLQGADPKVVCKETWVNHLCFIYSLAITPDSRVSSSGTPGLLITAAGDGKLTLRDTSATTTLTGHTGEVNCVTVTPDGRTAISGGDDCSLRVWSLAGEDRSTCTAVYNQHSRWVGCVAVNASGTLLASGSGDGAIWIWDVVKKDSKSGSGGSNISGGGGAGIELRPRGPALMSHKGAVRSLVMMQDGQQLVSASNDKTINVWSLVGGAPKLVRTLAGHEDRVRCLSVTPDESLLVSASHDLTMRVWEVASGRHVAICKGHNDWVVCCLVMGDGRTVVSGSKDGTMRMWDLGAVVRKLGGPAKVAEEVEEAEAKLEVYVDQGSDGVTCLGSSRDGGSVLTGGWDGTVKCWRPAV